LKKALLALADGRVFEGKALGAPGEAVGEVVFNTSMMGYQEIMTDPSYKGQIVTMTYPLIGNYGLNEEDIESSKPQVEGFIVKEASGLASNWRSRITLHDYLKERNIVGLQGIDTRALTKHIRDVGAQEGVISSADLDPQSLIAKARKSPGLIGRDLVKEVTCLRPYSWGQGEWHLETGYGEAAAAVLQKPKEQLELTPPQAKPYKVVAYDCGIKFNILRKLVNSGCEVTIVPAAALAEEVLALKPEGVFLSNGPGDPEGVPYVIKAVRQLIGQVPIFGICLGHQILALALGAKTYKLKFGHRGGNQPVKNLTTGKVEITAQNHGFAVDINSLPSGLELTHVNLNDNTCEGLRHKELPLFCVQYHPEASPGPHDASYLFKRFIDMMDQRR
jgi:carbamoyl-phosphate synthase small subunit